MAALADVLENPAQYRGQIELFFNARGNADIPARAANILVWRNTKRGIRYVFKKRGGEWL